MISLLRKTSGVVYVPGLQCLRSILGTPPRSTVIRDSNTREKLNSIDCASSCRRSLCLSRNPEEGHRPLSLEQCERTFVALKPDCLQRQLCGEVFQRFERKGFKICLHPLGTHLGR